jgi:hypothetical protein
MLTGKSDNLPGYSPYNHCPNETDTVQQGQTNGFILGEESDSK